MIAKNHRSKLSDNPPTTMTSSSEFHRLGNPPSWGLSTWRNKVPDEFVYSSQTEGELDENTLDDAIVPA